MIRFGKTGLHGSSFVDHPHAVQPRRFTPLVHMPGGRLWAARGDPLRRGIFACRHCYRLAYASSREDAVGRATRRADRLRARLAVLRGIRLIGPPREEIWYFAYGTNMHDSAFRQWRGRHIFLRKRCRV
jgi:hypothetical protein